MWDSILNRDSLLRAKKDKIAQMLYGLNFEQLDEHEQREVIIQLKNN